MAERFGLRRESHASVCCAARSSACASLPPRGDQGAYQEGFALRNALANQRPHRLQYRMAGLRQ